VLTAAGISAVVLVGSGGAVSYATSRGTAPTYVTASAGFHSVLQTLQATGTTQPSSAATVSFAVSGVVATVPIAMGEKVSAGQVLATLDDTVLKYALATAQGQVANADLTLTQVESGQVSAASGAGGGAGTANQTGIMTGSTGTSGATGSGGSSGTATKKTSTAGAVASTGTTGTGSGKTGTAGSTATTKSSGSSPSGSTASITAAQEAVLATVRQIDSLLTKTRTDLALATTLCTTQTTTPTPTPTTPATPPPTPTTPTTPATPSPTPTTPTTPTAPTTPSPTPTTPTTPTAPTTPAAPTPTPTDGKTTTSPAALTTTLATTQNVGLTATQTEPSDSCTQAQRLVLKDESQLLTLEQGLSAQETALDRLITSAVASTGTTPTGTASNGTASAGTATAGSPTAGSTTAGSATAGSATAGSATAGSATAGKTTGTAGTSTVAVSAAQLAADQAAVDAANANLTLAQQQLSQATIVSPFTGVVSSVGLTVGQQATAGSSTAAVDVIDPTGHGVTLSVDVTKIPQVKVGENAIVVPDGSSVPLAATVSYVAAAPTTSGSTAYNVQLAFTSNPTTLRDGIQAAVTITTAQAVNALAVPTSAVNHRGAISYVLVPNGSTTKTQLITIGSVGAVYTQVTGGLSAGQRVVLGNPSQPIPTNTVNGQVARITGGVTSGTAGVLGGTTGATTTRPGG
jgi:trimeric autotransporter adhesin